LTTYFILITVKAGTDARVMERLEKESAVKEVYEIYGAYDILAIADTNSFDEIKKIQTGLEKFNYVWTVQVEKAEKAKA